MLGLIFICFFFAYSFSTHTSVPNPHNWALVTTLKRDGSAVAAYVGTATYWNADETSVCGYGATGHWIALSDVQFDWIFSCECSPECPLNEYSNSCSLEKCGNEGCDGNCAPRCPSLPCGDKWCVKCYGSKCNNPDTFYQTFVSDACPVNHPCNVRNCCENGGGNLSSDWCRCLDTSQPNLDMSYYLFQQMSSLSNSPLDVMYLC